MSGLMDEPASSVDDVHPPRRATYRPPLENYSPKCGVLCIMVRDLKILYQVWMVLSDQSIKTNPLRRLLK